MYVVFDGIVAETLVEKEGGGDRIGGEEGCGRYRDNGIESGAAADVDEAEEKRCDRADKN